jgi:hypothetical protein
MRIGDDLHFENTVAEGDLQFERIDVTGSLIWDGLRISSRHGVNSNPPLDLRHARIGSALKAKNLSFVHPSLIDLCGMRVSAIENTWPQGWGSPNPDARARLVNLDGLTYDRIILSSAAEEGRASLRVRFEHLLPRIFGRRRDSLADKYDHWLKLQEKQTADDGNDFFPQPYRQLARVLRNQGEDGAARDIAIAEQWAAPKVRLLPRMARWAFGKGFGFGLRPGNAFMTLVAFLLLGMVGVHFVKDHDMLMESVVVASTGATPDGKNDNGGPGHLMRAMVRVDGSAGSAATEVECTDAANTWADDLVYAADMLVPFIPLHQEGKCEIVSSSDWPADLWRSLKAAYSVTGWVIFSLALVTFSGVLKRFDRDAA